MLQEDRDHILFWEKSKEKGRLKYCLSHGTVFGFTVFILVNLLKLKEFSAQEVFFTKQALQQALSMVIAGITGFATIKWWMNEQIYKKILRKEQESKKHP